MKNMYTSAALNSLKPGMPIEKVFANSTQIKADKYGLVAIPKVKLEQGGTILLEMHRFIQNTIKYTLI